MIWCDLTLPIGIQEGQGGIYLFLNSVIFRRPRFILKAHRAALVRYRDQRAPWETLIPHVLIHQSVEPTEW